MTGISQLPKRYQQTLNDYPFKAQVDWLTGTATASTWDAAIHEVWLRVNQGAWIEKIRKESVQKTINTYYNLVKKDKDVPIYNWYYVDVEPRDSYTQLLSSISNKPGVKWQNR